MNAKEGGVDGEMGGVGGKDGRLDGEGEEGGW